MAPTNKKIVDSASAAVTTVKQVKHKRRYCRAPGCTKIVKSQGLCQSHGAKPRKCKVDGCDKQAQGNFDGMCKSHFKQHRKQTAPLETFVVPPPTSSAATQLVNANEQHQGTDSASTAAAASAAAAATATNSTPPVPFGNSVYDVVLPHSISWKASSGGSMPLIQHLKDGFDKNKPSAWHRNEERCARGLLPVTNPATQLEGWERELVWMEILVLTGVPGGSFRHLARAWGRDKGFHMVLAQFICERRGNVERKKRVKGASGRGEGKRSKSGNSSNKNSDQEQDARVADVWDDACYGDAAYNEALAADLLIFHGDEDGDHGEVISSSDDPHSAAEEATKETETKIKTTAV